MYKKITYAYSNTHHGTMFLELLCLNIKCDILPVLKKIIMTYLKDFHIVSQLLIFWHTVFLIIVYVVFYDDIMRSSWKKIKMVWSNEILAIILCTAVKCHKI